MLPIILLMVVLVQHMEINQTHYILAGNGGLLREDPCNPCGYFEVDVSDSMLNITLNRFSTEPLHVATIEA
jgi:hypothetical protein